MPIDEEAAAARAAHRRDADGIDRAFSAYTQSLGLPAELCEPHHTRANPKRVLKRTAVPTYVCGDEGERGWVFPQLYVDLRDPEDAEAAQPTKRAEDLWGDPAAAAAGGAAADPPPAEDDGRGGARSFAGAAAPPRPAPGGRGQRGWETAVTRVAAGPDGRRWERTADRDGRGAGRGRGQQGGGTREIREKSRFTRDGSESLVVAGPPVPRDASQEIHDLLKRVNAQTLVIPKGSAVHVIKSFGDGDVARSVVHGVWASTDGGNRNMARAWADAAGAPVFLIFSVNGSGRFCGLAQMNSDVDFSQRCGFWDSSRFSGRFDVRWLLLKDVPNAAFRRLEFDTAEGPRSVVRSRDTQRIPGEVGREMLRVFAAHRARGSLLDSDALRTRAAAPGDDGGYVQRPYDEDEEERWAEN